MSKPNPDYKPLELNPETVVGVMWDGKKTVPILYKDLPKIPPADWTIYYPTTPNEIRPSR